MDFIKLNNNNLSNKMTMVTDCCDKIKVNSPVSMRVYGNSQLSGVSYNYNFEDEYCFVEKFDLDEDDKDGRRGKMCSNARVILEKLPDSVVQQYLAKKMKNCKTINCGKKLSDSSMQQHIFEKENLKIINCRENSLLKQCFTRKESSETDKFVRELHNPIMQQYLANTEMGSLTVDLMDQIPETRKYPVKSSNCSIDSLLENLSDNNNKQYLVEMDNNNQTGSYVENLEKSILQKYSVEMEKCCKVGNFTKGPSYPAVQQCIVDLSDSVKQLIKTNVKKIDSMKKPINLALENSSKNVIKMKSGISHKQRRKNGTIDLCQRICPICKTYTKKLYKASAKVKCNNCHILTFYECNKCRKLVQTYSGISDHLLYRCDAQKLHKCAHCKYSVRKKRALAWHIKKTHEKLILRNLIVQNKDKSTDKIINKSDQGSTNNKRFENLIVLKKQKEMTCKSEWYIENVKRSDVRVDKNISTSVPVKTTSTLLMKNSNSAKKMAQLFCEHCNKKIAIDASSINTEILCSSCGTVLRFKCLKCYSTCESYNSMKHHLMKVCAFKKNHKKSFHCSKCNYRSFFQGLVINHQNQIHSFNESHELSSDNLIQNHSRSD